MSSEKEIEWELLESWEGMIVSFGNGTIHIQLRKDGSSKMRELDARVAWEGNFYGLNKLFRMDTYKSSGGEIRNVYTKMDKPGPEYEGLFDAVEMLRDKGSIS